MKILLIGECSGVHSTLAKGLRTLGHEVCVASNGNGWKGYPLDILIERKKTGFYSGLRCMGQVIAALPKMRGFDVVQIIQPPFVPLRAGRLLPLYKYLRRNNGKVFMGAYGTDHYYVKSCLETDIFRYSDFRIGNRPIKTKVNEADIREYMNRGTAAVTKEIASTCNGIISCLWEYYATYSLYFPEKTTFIPLPFDMSSVKDAQRVRTKPKKTNIFLGIQKARHEIKGTDVMLRAAQRIAERYPDLCNLTVVTDVPYKQYIDAMSGADIMLDQLYSYTPAMNALLAMAEGIVVCGGGEPENYEILGEKSLRPIINVYPSEEDVYKKLEDTVLNNALIPELSAQSIEYVVKHHDHIKVTQQYLDYWMTH